MWRNVIFFLLSKVLSFVSDDLRQGCLFVQKEEIENVLQMQNNDTNHYKSIKTNLLLKPPEKY